MRKSITTVIIHLLLMAGLSASFVFAQAPNTMLYQGRLTDSEGDPASSPQIVTFAIYDSLTEGTALWCDTLFVSLDSLGIFMVELGLTKAFESSVFDGSKRYLGITVGDEAEMEPRQTLTASPYAFGANSVPDSSVTSAKIAPLAVGAAQLATDCISSEKILDGTVEETDIAENAVTSTKLALNSVTKNHIQQNAITSDRIQDGSVTSIDIADAGITSTKLAANSVGSGHLQSNAVNSGKIQDASITGSDIASGTITSSKLASSSVGNSQLQSGAVTSSKLGSGSVYSSHISSGAVGTSQLASSVDFGSSGSSGYVEVWSSISGRKVDYLGGNTSGAGYISTNTSSGGTAAHFNTHDGGLHGSLSVYNSSGTNTCGMRGGTGLVFGTTKSFIVPDPQKQDRLIRYTCVEGPEAAIYIRGTGELASGFARVDFPEHFASMATENSITLTLTPRSADSKGLAAINVSSYGFDVAELLSGKGSYSFDYVAYAVRKGYEDYKVYLDSNEFFNQSDEPVVSE
jgi:hypothetical protein